MMHRLFLLLGMLSLCVGLMWVWVWWSRRDETRGLHSREELLRVLQRTIPAGTPLAEAQLYMERRGFRCEPQVDQDWKQWLDPGSPGAATQVTRRGIDFVYCWRHDSRWLFLEVDERLSPIRVPFPVLEKWGVGLVHSDGVVAEILVNHHLTK